MPPPIVPINTTPFFKGAGGNSPQAKINDKANDLLGPSDILAFPPDVPKYYTLLMEHEWIGYGLNLGVDKKTWYKNNLGTIRAYRLPLPTHLTDSHEIQYDHGFNWFSQLLQQTTTAINNLTGPLGFSLNSFKTVTLQTPQFRSYAYEFKMSPKTPQESQAIRRIYSYIKQGMHPEPRAGRSIMMFPRIYWLGFMPNAGWLFKTKPSVITSCTIDYQGGNGQPAFYSATQAPEGVVMRLSFLELEYWMRPDFNHILSNDPFDSSALYTTDIELPKLDVSEFITDEKTGLPKVKNPLDPENAGGGVL